VALAALAGGARASALDGDVAPVIRIDLRTAAEIEGDRVLLGDVAALSGSDGEQVERLRRLEVGRGPAAGAPARLERSQLARWLPRRTGIPGRSLDWRGAARCELRRAVRRLPAGDVVARAIAGTVEALSGKGLRVAATPSGMLADLEVPAGTLALEPRPLPPDAAVARRLTVRVDVRVAGRLVRSVPVNLELEVFGPGLVATEGQAAGARLDVALLEPGEIRWSGRGSPPLPLAALENVRLRRPLAKGEPVTRALVESAPMVARGERATLRASAGLVRLEGRVEVLQDGFAGQTVPVKLPGATGSVAARVVGRGNLEVPQ
jgi:flagella basal body P-ring formation protein FlgA